MFQHSRLSLGGLVVAGQLLGAMVADRAAAADVALGEYLSGECVTCHQRSGRGEGIPPIVGWPAESFVAVIASYKTKERDNIVMQTIAARLQDDEIAALAVYFEIGRASCRERV